MTDIAKNIVKLMAGWGILTINNDRHISGLICDLQRQAIFKKKSVEEIRQMILDSNGKKFSYWEIKVSLDKQWVRIK